MVVRFVTALALLGASLSGPVRALEPAAEPAGSPRPSAGAPPAPAAQPPAEMPALAPAPAAAAPAARVEPKPVHAKPAPAPPPEPVKLSDDPEPTVSPGTFVATMRAAERYQAIVESGGWPTVPNEAIHLKPGDRSPAIGPLRARLAATGELAGSDRPGATFDEPLVAALRRFPTRHGREETGRIGPRTLFHLNVAAATRLRQLQGSASRLMASKFPFGERYVAVNIPSAAVEAVEAGRVSRRYVAIVGQTDRPSPQVETRVTSINFNPTWTVPVSLIRKDIIPHVRKDPGYLARMKIRLFDQNGAEVDPATIDWSTEKAANYTVRQDSGASNSLGEIRIDMPNRHAVYMHDTPSKRLFARTSRTRSSGCVRVSGVKELAAWLLEGTSGPAGARWGASEIDAAIAGGRRVDARLSRAVPVAWVYLTGYATADGTVHFRDDVYGLDEGSAPGAAPLTIEALVTSSVAPTR